MAATVSVSVATDLVPFVAAAACVEDQPCSISFRAANAAKPATHAYITSLPSKVCVRA